MSKFTPEGKVKAAIKRVLKLHEATTDGWWPVPAGYGENWLDYQGCNAGRFFAIEAKAPGKPLRPLQVEVKRRIERVGGRVFVIDSEDCDDMRALKEWLI